jgi:hypothetical protein
MANETNDDRPYVRHDEIGRPLYSYNIPGGPYPKNLRPARVPKRSEYERGSAEDRAGNRGR